MTITTISGRQFNQDASKAKRAAKSGPVFITDRGRPAHVLLTYEAYQRLSGNQMSLADALAGPPEFDFDFEPPRLGREPVKPAEFD
jgi:Antitoxin Phd_YefM, type II toxin-antitoxin system